MSAEPWSNRPKIDEVSLTDILMRRVPTSGTKNQEITISDVQAFLQGSAITLVASEADLPSLINGSHILDPAKNYIFTEPGLYFDNIVIPAGYIGWIRSNFLSPGTITYLGSGSFFNTLNIDGILDAITDAGGSAVTVSTSAPHGLVNGQFVNITGTTNYNGQRLKISNAGGSVFDVVLPFVINEFTGAFDTGFQALQISNIDFTNDSGANLFDLTSTGDIASFLITDFMTELGFLSPGIIRKCPSVGIRISVLGFDTGGLILEDCVNTAIEGSAIVDIGVVPGVIALTFQGSATSRVVVDGNSIDMFDTTQRPIRIDSNIATEASVTIQRTPDNLVAIDYFDTSAGGLDETEPRVIARNNGARANSMSSAQVGFTNIAVPIVVTIATQDVPAIIGGTQFISSELERATADIAGQITNTTKVTKKIPITFSALIEKVGGGTTDIGLLIIKNGSFVLTETFEIPHSVNSGVIQISATRDFELAEDDTIELAVVNFDGTADVSVSQANISYSVET